MATRIMVLPAEDYFVAFLATRGINLNIENPEVIHYFGSSYREIKKIAKEKDPDLVVIQDPKAIGGDIRFPFVLDEVKNDRDIYRNRSVTTNAPDLARLHYQSLGLERMIHDCSEPKDEKPKEKLKINVAVVKKIFTAMMWE